MKRLFAAVKIHPDDDFFNSFRKMKSALRHESIKWVEENNIHITVKFLGETEERLIPDIVKTLKKRTEEMAPFELGFSKTGLFGSTHTPRVVWVGIEPYDRLTVLMRDVQKDMEQLGYEIDRQNLVPHLTLGRIKSLKDRLFFQNVMNSQRQFSRGIFLIEELILFESVLRKEGPEYKIINRFPFNMPGEPVGHKQQLP